MPVLTEEQAKEVTRMVFLKCIQHYDIGADTIREEILVAREFEGSADLCKIEISVKFDREDEVHLSTDEGTFWPMELKSLDDGVRAMLEDMREDDAVRFESDDQHMVQWLREDLGDELLQVIDLMEI